MGGAGGHGRRAWRTGAFFGATALVTVLCGASCNGPEYASLENRTGWDLLLFNERYRLVGEVPAGESDGVEVGWAPDCIEGLRALTSDGKRVADVPGYVCGGDDLILFETAFTPAGSFVVRNATGLDLANGLVGWLEVGPIGAGQDRVLPLAVAAGGCTTVDQIVYVARNSDGETTAVAEFPGQAEACDGDAVSLEPWMTKVGQVGDAEWQPLAPSPAPSASPQDPPTQES